MLGPQQCAAAGGVHIGGRRPAGQPGSEAAAGHRQACKLVQAWGRGSLRGALLSPARPRHAGRDGVLRARCWLLTPQQTACARALVLPADDTLFARRWVVLHARAFGLQPIDQVYVSAGCCKMHWAAAACLSCRVRLSDSCTTVGFDAAGSRPRQGPLSKHPMVTHAQPLCSTQLVQIDYKNSHGLQAEALEGRSIGMAGKQVIHPSQIGPVQASWAGAQGVEQCRGCCSTARTAECVTQMMVASGSMLASAALVPLCRRPVPRPLDLLCRTRSARIRTRWRKRGSWCRHSRSTRCRARGPSLSGGRAGTCLDAAE